MLVGAAGRVGPSAGGGVHVLQQVRPLPLDAKEGGQGRCVGEGG
jgi:hypothetical protein